VQVFPAFDAWLNRPRPTVLASWTWLAEETQGDEGAAKLQEGQMDVSPVLVADLQAPEAVEPWTAARPLLY
jgi:hypothetical protein